MRRNGRSIALLIPALCALALPQIANADYVQATTNGFNGVGNTGFVSRGGDDGATFITSYTAAIPANERSNIESFGQAAALSPDLSKVYDFVNTLGFSNVVFVSDTATGQYLPSDTFQFSATIPPAAGDTNYINQASQPLITSSEMLVLSEIYPTTNWQVKRFNLASHALVQVIDPPTPQRLDDIALSASGNTMYVAGTGGIYVYNKLGLNFTPVTLSPLIPVDGYIALGPDNRLYVNNFANGNIERYTTAGAFIDTFISHNTYPSLGTVQFGVDGNLHVFQQGSVSVIPKILTFSPISGSLLFSTPTQFSNGRVTYLFAPEPSAAVLLGICAMGVLVQARPKRNGSN